MKLFILIITLLILLNPLAAEASVLPACTATGNCGLCDFFDTFINIINWLLGVVGGIALFLFGWHGFGMITSAGNPEKVTAARKGMMHTVLGIVIIIFSWFLVTIIIGILLSTPGSTGDDAFKNTLFNNEAAWNQYCVGKTDIKKCQGRGLGSPCGSGNFCYPDDGNKKVLTCTNSAFIDNKDGDALIEVKNACEYWANRPLNPKEGFHNNPYTGDRKSVV